jgi:hypothetical protein
VKVVNLVMVRKVHAAQKVQAFSMVHAEMAIVIIMVRDQPMHQVLLHQGHQQILHLLIQRPVRILRLHRGLAVRVMGDMLDKVKSAVGVMVDKTTCYLVSNKLWATRKLVAHNLLWLYAPGLILRLESCS